MWIVGRRLPSELTHPPDHVAFPRSSPAFCHPHASPGSLGITWVGHSTVLVQLGRINILTDPIWSERASPLAHMGPHRWVPPAVGFDALPPIDVVLLSHDHYDHLNALTVRRLGKAHGAATWLVPLRVAPLLRRLGIERVVELDWWQHAHVAGAHMTCVPAQHFSGRSLRDRGRTLWCGWTVQTAERRVFFAGDTALHPDFDAIAQVAGPFDAVILPIGAYAPRRYMRSVHMSPADAVQAYRALTGAHPDAELPVMVPVHWGTFRLTDEPMHEPPERLLQAWTSAALPPERLWLLTHGETRTLTRGGANPTG